MKIYLATLSLIHSYYKIISAPSMHEEWVVRCVEEVKDFIH